MDEIAAPWFKEGLAFKCTGCGKCCTGSDGYVFLSAGDITTLATHHAITPEQFTQKFTRLVNGEYALLDTPGTGDCIFLKENQCSVYTARPLQCRTFPWWVHNLRSPEDWAEAATHCEGINHPEAPLIPATHIEEQCLSHLGNLIEHNFH